MGEQEKVAELRSLFLVHSNPEKAIEMESYMKNNFPFLGLQAPIRRTIQKQWINSNKSLAIDQKWSLIFELWDQPEREFQLTAVDWLIQLNKKDWCIDDHKKLEQLIVSKSWWDTVDLIASNCVANFIALFYKTDNSLLYSWGKSNNIWLQRTCLLFQLKYKSNVNIPLLTEFISDFHSNKDFFIQKAIGWSLRELSKIYPNQTKEIIANYAIEGLAKREALKWISNHAN
jgi:3-methyladenine DNA glycosylase AlkD